MKIKLIFIVLLVGLVLVFIFQNVAAVEIQFFSWSLLISRSLLMFINLFIGIILGWVLSSYMHHRKRKKNEAREIE